MKYHAICDNGSRCQTCCNRSQLFGYIDVLSLWTGDCGECNIRWYRNQLRSTSRNTRDKMHGNCFFVFGRNISALIFRYAGIDVEFYRLGVIFRRKMRMMTSILTNMVDSDDEYYEDD